MTWNCADCGDLYGEEAVIVDSETWEKIADGAYFLCFKCMDKRLTKSGLTAECDIARNGISLRTRVAHPMWRTPEMVAHESVGHPSLFRKA